jgi:trk system potassium uptake protein TrkH
MKYNPYVAIPVGFASVILLGVFTLLLPWSTADGHGLPFFDALFTATSATCVTGLSTIGVGRDLTPLGQAAVLIMVQIGGLGLMTLSTFFGLLLGVRPQLRDRLVLREALNQVDESHSVNLIWRIIIFTAVMEIAGAGLLYHGFADGASFGKRLYLSLFHSISAFCNAGFTLFDDSLISFAGDPVLVLTVIILVVVGGLGFWVVNDLLEYLRSRIRRGPLHPLALHTRVVGVMTLILVLGGALMFMLVEGSSSPQGSAGSRGFLMSLFQSVTTRTAGFNTVDVGALALPTLIWMMIWMFIGASPGSTGGGIKTTTFAVMLASFRSVLSGRERVELGQFSLPETVVRRAHAVFLASLLWVVSAIFLMSIAGVQRGATSFLQVLFETISAFGTVGLSMGITGELTSVGKVILVITMFAGRIGPLTLILAMAQRTGRPQVTYPEQVIPIG